jgi:hypothetical protein
MSSKAGQRGTGEQRSRTPHSALWTTEMACPRRCRYERRPHASFVQQAKVDALAPRKPAQSCTGDRFETGMSVWRWPVRH